MGRELDYQGVRTYLRDGKKVKKNLYHNVIDERFYMRLGYTYIEVKKTKRGYMEGALK
jgi:hypothetical protein